LAFMRWLLKINGLRNDGKWFGIGLAFSLLSALQSRKRRA
jgi:hypothetical protein